MTASFYMTRRFVAVLVTLLFFTGCGDQKVFTDGENETKPAVADPRGVNALSAAGNATRFKGYYNFYVRRKGKEEIVCQGEAQIINSEQGTATTGLANCTDPILVGAGVKEIKIEDDLNEASEELPWDEAKRLGLDPRISRIVRKGDTVFEPYLPNLLGPIIQNPKEFADINDTTKITVKSKDKDGSPVSSSGTVNIKVLEADIEYQPEGYFETFDEVLRYQINATGFDELPNKSDVGLYQTFEYYWSTQPIAILHVHIAGPVKDFEDSKFRGFAGNIIFGGGIVIDLVLKEHIQVTN